MHGFKYIDINLLIDIILLLVRGDAHTMYTLSLFLIYYLLQEVIYL